MADIRISEMTSRVDVTDTDALLSSRVMTQIIRAVMAELEHQQREAQARHDETRIGARGDKR